MMKYIRGTIFWFNFVTVTIVLYILLVAVVAILSIFKPAKRSHGAHWVATLWGRTLMALAPGWHADIRGKEHLPKDGDHPVVMVANHQSGADIWALYLTGAQFRWLSKKEVFRLPLIGTAMRWAGYVPINRGARSSHSEALKLSADWIRAGVSMVFFPEGTRSEDGRLKEFKVGAFRLAMECQVPIQPLVIRGTVNMMRKSSLLPNPAKVEVEILPRIYPFNNEGAEEFAARVQKVFEARLDHSDSKLHIAHAKAQPNATSINVPATP